MAKRSRKSFEGWRRKYLGDLRHALRCCQARRLPPQHAEYLSAILHDERLPKPKEVSKAIQLTNEQREQNKLWTIPPIDMTPAQLAKQRRAKDRRRKMLARRRARMQTRAEYLAQFPKPWIAAGIPRSTWYRLKAKGETGLSEQPKLDETGPSARI